MNGTTAYALSKKYVEDTSISLGAVKGAPCTIKSITEVDGGQKVTFEWTGTSGTKQTSEMTVKNGVSVIGISDKGNGKFTLLFSDGSESDPIQCVKGSDGVSPTAKVEKVGDTATITITDKDGTTTATIKDGQGGSGGTAEVPIESISVNDTVITPDENKNVNIEVPNIYVGDTEPIDDSIEVWFNPNGESSSIEVPIEKIKVNGELQTPVNKVVDITVPKAYDDTALVQRVTDIESDYVKSSDIPTKVSQLENDSNYLSSIPEEYITDTELSAKGYLTEHQDISGKVDKVEGKSLISDTEIARLASVDNYDDTQVKTAIQAVANGLMDSVGYSADYKSIDIIAKNGVKKSVNVAPIISHASITELSDVDTTNKATGKALVYNATTNKHEYADVSGTDEKVKMDASTDAKYLGELLDNITIANENGKLKVKKLDGQEVTITEINYLKGLTMNVMDLVNMFSNGGVKIINTPVATYAELLTIDKSSFIEGVSYLVYVLADENHDNAKTTYLVDKDSEIPTYFGFADSQRDFTTNPIDLATEITGKLGIANMDSDAIKALFTVDDTYKTETATNNAFSTHGAKALYDELLLAIGNKANSSDLTAHKDDADIHVSTEDRTKWDSAKTHADSAHAPSNAQANVLETVKVNGTVLEISDKAVNVTVPTKVAELTDSADYAKSADIPTTLPANGGNADTVNGHTVKSDVPENAVFTDTVYDDTEVQKRISDNGYGEVAGGKNLLNHNIIDSKITNCSVLFKNDTFYATNKGNYSHFVLSASTIVGKSYTVTIKDWSDYSYRCIASVSDLNDNTLVSMVITDATLSMTFTAVGTKSLIQISPNNTPNEMSNTITFKCMLEEGSVATEYEPYFQSNKMLTEENAQQSSNLDTLKYSDIAGGKNLFNGNFIEKVLDIGTNYTDVDLSKKQNTIKDIKGLTFATFGAYLKKGTYTLSYTNDAYFSLNRVAIAGTDCVLAIESIRKSYTWTQNVDGWTYFGIEGDDSETGVTDTPFSVTPDIQIEKGTEATAYEPYIPSVKMLDGVVNQQNKSLSVIGKCKNLLNSKLQTTEFNGVTCTDNGDGTYTLNGTAIDKAEFILSTDNTLIKGVHYLALLANNFYAGLRMFIQKQLNPWTIYYTCDSGSILNVVPNENLSEIRYVISINKDTILDNVIVKPMITTDLNATFDDFVPYTGDGKTLTHDVAKLNENLSALGKCKNLLNPTLQTTTENGVTCTRNVDGTYTVNGTNSTSNFITLFIDTDLKLSNGLYKVIGNSPTNRDCRIVVNLTSGDWVLGDGVNSIFNGSDYAKTAISIKPNASIDNVVLKPMITTNLSATYDDFVPYTGDGETLAHDVAELKNDLGGLTFSASGTTLSITDGTNTWTLVANS